MKKQKKIILDACCGERMMWFDKRNRNTLFLDNREEVNPDIVGDFRNLKLPDKSFKLVVWDVPHIIQREIGKSQMAKHYGVLSPDAWKEDLRKGFNECWRVLDDYGVLIFKWSDCNKWANKSRNVNLKEILKLFHTQPLFGHKTKSKFDIKENKEISASYWLCFMKNQPNPKPMTKEEIIKEFEEEISIDGELRYSTRVEPRLCDAEKTKKWLKKRLQAWQEDL